MLSTLISKLDKESLSKVQKPSFEDIKQYDFSELYETGETFYRIAYYDRSEYYSSDKKTVVVATKEDHDIVLARMNEYNEKLKQIQTEVINSAIADRLISEYTSQEYFSLSRVKSDLGLCHINNSEINKEKEQEKRRNTLKSNVNCNRCGDGGCPQCEPWRFI